MVGGEEEDARIMEGPSDGLHEKQKHGRIHGEDRHLWRSGVDGRLLAV